MANILDKPQHRVADWINLVLGIVLFVSPWLFQFAGTGLAAWNAWIGGIVVAVLALAALFRFAEWEEWLSAAIGVWFVLSPWVLGFAGTAGALWTHVILGIVIAVLAAWHGWTAHKAGGTHATA